jgi:PIN domain nuclease of toxin-antitoxin system
LNLLLETHIWIWAGRGRLTIDGDVAEWIERSVRSTLTAAVHGLTLVTADKHLTRTKEFAVLAN